MVFGMISENIRISSVRIIEAAVNQPFAEGLATERETFLRLVASDQSKAQRHVFFAERQVTKIPDVPKDTPTRAIQKVGVIGAGTMGNANIRFVSNARVQPTPGDQGPPPPTAQLPICEPMQQDNCINRGAR